MRVEKWTAADVGKRVSFKDAHTGLPRQGVVTKVAPDNLFAWIDDRICLRPDFCELSYVS